MRVYVAVRVRRPGITVHRLRRVAGHVLRRQRCATETEVAVALVSDAAIRRLNRRFLGLDRPTDVLSFPANRLRARAGRGRFRHPASAILDRAVRHYIGDVVISVDRARVQARAVGHPARTEIALLTVHGLLHLLGYGDRRRADAAKMTRRQRLLAAEAGFEVAG
jgi:probable rRNA maturation factor